MWKHTLSPLRKGFKTHQAKIFLNWVMIYVYGKVIGQCDFSFLFKNWLNFPVKNHTTHNPEQSEKLHENNITLERAELSSIHKSPWSLKLHFTANPKRSIWIGMKITLFILLTVQEFTTTQLTTITLQFPCL